MLIKVWDCADESASCLHTFSHHKSKVQSVAWSPVIQLRVVHLPA